MKYARLRIDHAEEAVHPMHAFEMRHDRIEWAELLHWNVSFDETNTQVFRVRGAPDPFRAKLEERDATEAYSVTEAVDGIFYCCVRDRLTDAVPTRVRSVVPSAPNRTGGPAPSVPRARASACRRLAAVRRPRGQRE